MEDFYKTRNPLNPRGYVINVSNETFALKIEPRVTRRVHAQTLRLSGGNKRIADRYFGPWSTRVVSILGCRFILERVYIGREFRPLEVDREITRIVMDLLRRWRAPNFWITRGLCGPRPSLFAHPHANAGLLWTEISAGSSTDSSDIYICSNRYEFLGVRELIDAIGVL